MNTDKSYAKRKLHELRGLTFQELCDEADSKNNLLCIDYVPIFISEGVNKLLAHKEFNRQFLNEHEIRNGNVNRGDIKYDLDDLPVDELTIFDILIRFSTGYPVNLFQDKSITERCKLPNEFSFTSIY